MARKRKHTHDERQLLLFSMTEMEGNVRQESPVPPAEPLAEAEAMPAPTTQETITFGEDLGETLFESDHDRLLSSMRSAISILSSLNKKQVRLIAMESAAHAQLGISSERIYRLPALNHQELSGYDFVAIYYVSFARSFPDMLEKIGLPYADMYEEALSQLNQVKNATG